MAAALIALYDLRQCPSDRWKILLSTAASVPELLTVKVEFGTCFDFTIAVHFRLTGEPHFLLMTDSSEESERIDPRVQPFPDSALADVLFAPFDVHATAAAQSVASAIEVPMWP